MAAKFQTRSVSLPTRSHPTTIKIDEELNRLRTFDPSSAAGTSSSAICNGLSSLRDVYDSLDELLNMGSTQEALSRRNGQCMEEELFLNGSVKLLDSVEITRDVISGLKENVAALQSAIRRRRKGDSSLEASVSSYIQLRRKTRKDAKKLVAKLKQQMDNVNYKLADHDDEHFSAVIRVLREVNAVSSCVFQALLSFVAPVCGRTKQSKWGIASKLMMMRKVAAVGCEGCGVNEVQAADVALLAADDQKKEFGKKELEAVESCLEEIESGLEAVFRRMIKSRASVLNILSQ